MGGNYRKMSIYGNNLKESLDMIQIEDLLDESFDTINISAEEVCRISEYFNSIDPGLPINEASASDNMSKMFTKLGVANEKSSKAKQVVNKASKDIADDIKKNGPDPLEITCHNCGSVYKIPVNKI